MNTWEIRATIWRSNPQIMRQIRMKAGYTMEELGQIVCVSMGMDRGTPFKLSKGGEQLSLSSSMDTQLALGDCLEMSLDGKIQWKLILDVSASSAASGTPELPVVTRYRGFHPNMRCQQITELNQYHTNVSDRAYWNSWQREKPRYQFNGEQVEKDMRRLLMPDTLPREINPELSMPLKELLGTWKVIDLKQLVQDMDIAVWTGQNKKPLINDMAAEMTRKEFLRNLFMEMGSLEYRNFQMLCYGEKTEFPENLAAFPTLIQCGMIAQTYEGEFRVCRELLKFYEKWNGSEEEKAMVLKRQVKTCILAGCRLYAVLSREQAERIYQKCYPETYSKSKFLENWKQYNHQKQVHETVEILNPSTMYDQTAISKREALVWINQAVLKESRWYVPDREEAERIAGWGIQFPEDTAQEFRLFLKGQMNCWNEGLQCFLIGQICQGCHVHADTDVIVDYVCQNLNMRRKSRIATQLGQLIDRHRGEVREVGLYGYTSKEFAEVMHG